MTDSPKNRSRKLMEDFAKFEAWLNSRFPNKRGYRVRPKPEGIPELERVWKK